jgi:hypothetical protein
LSTKSGAVRAVVRVLKESGEIFSMASRKISTRIRDCRASRSKRTSPGRWRREDVSPGELAPVVCRAAWEARKAAAELEPVERRADRAGLTGRAECGARGLLIDFLIKRPGGAAQKSETKGRQR